MAQEQTKCRMLSAVALFTFFVSKPTIDFCLLPSVTGPCRASMPRYFYNKRTGKCEKFIFGGCRGNKNNFRTLKECENQCRRRGIIIRLNSAQIKSCQTDLFILLWALKFFALWSSMHVISIFLFLGSILIIFCRLLDLFFRDISANFLLSFLIKCPKLSCL